MNFTWKFIAYRAVNTISVIKSQSFNALHKNNRCYEIHSKRKCTFWAELSVLEYKTWRYIRQRLWFRRRSTHLICMTQNSLIRLLLANSSVQFFTTPVTRTAQRRMVRRFMNANSIGFGRKQSWSLRVTILTFTWKDLGKPRKKWRTGGDLKHISPECKHRVLAQHKPARFFAITNWSTHQNFLQLTILDTFPILA